jgi:hypothetical protein
MTQLQRCFWHSMYPLMPKRRKADIPVGRHEDHSPSLRDASTWLSRIRSVSRTRNKKTPIYVTQRPETPPQKVWKNTEGSLLRVEAHSLSIECGLFQQKRRQAAHMFSKNVIEMDSQFSTIHTKQMGESIKFHHIDASFAWPHDKIVKGNAIPGTGRGGP